MYNVYQCTYRQECIDLFLYQCTYRNVLIYLQESLFFYIKNTCILLRLTYIYLQKCIMCINVHIGMSGFIYKSNSFSI